MYIHGDPGLSNHSEMYSITVDVDCNVRIQKIKGEPERTSKALDVVCSEGEILCLIAVLMLDARIFPLMDRGGGRRGRGLYDGSERAKTMELSVGPIRSVWL